MIAQSSLCLSLYDQVFSPRLPHLCRHAKVTSSYSNVCGFGWEIWLLPKRRRLKLFPSHKPGQNHAEQRLRALMTIWSQSKSKGIFAQHCTQFTKEAELDKPVRSPQAVKRKRGFALLVTNTNYFPHCLWQDSRTVCDFLFGSHILSSGPMINK